MLRYNENIFEKGKTKSILRARSACIFSEESDLPVILHPRLRAPSRKISTDNRAESACLRMAFRGWYHATNRLANARSLAHSPACEQTISARIVEDKEQEMLLSPAVLRSPVTRLHSRWSRHLGVYPCCTRSASHRRGWERIVTVGERESHFCKDTWRVPSSELRDRHDGESRNFIT